MEPLKVEENECSDPDTKAGLFKCEHTQSCEGSSYVTSQLVQDESPNHLWHNVCPDTPQNPNSGKHNQPFVIKTESDNHAQSFSELLSEDKDKRNREESCVIVIKPETESGILDKCQGGYTVREIFEIQSKECTTEPNVNSTYIVSNQVDELLNEQSEWNADEIVRDQASDRQYSTEGCHVQLTSEEPAITQRLMNTACTAFTCQTCHAVFSCQSELTIHLRSHTGERPFACQTCDKRFSEFGFFTKHLRTHKAKGQYVCPTCNKGFVYCLDLIKHFKVHTRDPSSGRLTFEKTSSRIEAFTKRIINRKEQPRVCPSCNKRYLKSSALKKHIRKIHTGEQPHACPTYKKGFVSSPVDSIPVTSYSSNEVSTSTVSDVSQTHSGSLTRKQVDCLDKLPGYDRVESFTTYLVELEKGQPKHEITLKREQTEYIVKLWKNMLPFDRFPITQLSSANMTESKKRRYTRNGSSQTQHPSCCRVVESLCVKLCLNHPCSKDVHGQTLKRWTQILRSYNRIFEMVLSSKLVMDQTHLQLVELDQFTLIQWYNKKRDLRESCAVMHGLDVSAETAPSKESSVQSPKSPQIHTTSEDSFTLGPKKLRSRKSGIKKTAKLQQSHGVTCSQNQTKEKYDKHQTWSKQLSPPSSVKGEGSSMGLLHPQGSSQPELTHKHSGINKINKVTTETRQVESWKHHTLMHGLDVSAAMAPSKESSVQSPKSPQSHTTSQDSFTMVPKKLGSRKSGIKKIAKLQQAYGVKCIQNQTKEKYDLHQTCSKQLSPPSSLKGEGSSLGLLHPQGLSQPELTHKQNIDEHSGINTINRVTTETRQVESWKHHREADPNGGKRTIDKGCASNGALTVHITKHNEKHPFVCNLCGKRFTRFLQFKEHVTKCKKCADNV